MEAIHRLLLGEKDSWVQMRFLRQTDAKATKMRPLNGDHIPGEPMLGQVFFLLGGSVCVCACWERARCPEFVAMQVGSLAAADVRLLRGGGERPDCSILVLR